ncbi:LysR family transcriptional regulator, partial [Acinetobacter baumannii]|uniref:LysR family transcriptional regulator n=1 Tax=Acinetobacter baumannii TaxID=470 RepID=UPI003B83E0A7
MQHELSAISIFVTVVEAGSFVKAAEQLHLTRSAISKNIARLEDQLGVALFKRTTRSLSMTDEGALFYEHSRRALSEISVHDKFHRTLILSGFCLLKIAKIS